MRPFAHFLAICSLPAMVVLAMMALAGVNLAYWWWVGLLIFAGTFWVFGRSIGFIKLEDEEDGWHH